MQGSNGAKSANDIIAIVKEATGASEEDIKHALQASRSGVMAHVDMHAMMAKDNVMTKGKCLP